MKLPFRPASRLVMVAASMVALAWPAAITAQSPAKEGRFDFVACWSGTSNAMPFSKTHSAYTMEFTGMTRSNIADSPFDNNSFRCIGVGGNLGGSATMTVYCESVDRDGDKRLAVYHTDAGGKTSRETVAGTGKFEGITSTIDVVPLGPFPVVKPGTFQNCNRQSGTYRMK